MSKKCPCGYTEECVYWCGRGHISGDCPPFPPKRQKTALKAEIKRLKQELHDMQDILHEMNN